MGWLIRLLFTFASLCAYCRAQLRIVSPPEVVSQFQGSSGFVKGTTATFGAPMYGETVIGRLVYVPDPSNNHCSDKYTLPVTPDDSETDASTVDKLFIIMVDRGNCTFVKKVAVAQDAKKAEAVIIVDNQGLTIDELNHVIMADDGYGERIRIPSVMITQTDGKKLQQAVMAAGSREILVELQWDIPQRYVVSVDFWSDAGLDKANQFLVDYAHHAEMLGPNIRFLPHYHMFDVNSDYNSLCWKDPQNRPKKICSQDPDGAGQITGEDVVLEDLRQLCVFYKVHKESDPALPNSLYSPKFWEYIKAFNDPSYGCSRKGTDPNYKFGEQCSYRVMYSVGINVDAVKKCANDPNVAYDLLRNEVENMAWAPLALRINGWRFSGILDADLVTKAVCSGFVTEPQACKTLKEEAMTKSTITRIISGAGMSVMGVLGLFALLLLIVAVGFYLYQRHLTKSVRAALRQEVMLEVKTQMQDYHQLSEDGIPESHRQTRPLIL